MKNLVVRRVIFLTIFFMPLFLPHGEDAVVFSQEGFYGSIAYLRWKAQEDQLQYTSKLPNGIPASDANPFVFIADVVNQKFSFDSGFRLTAGYIFCEDWDARVRFTRFNQCSQGSVSSDVFSPDIGMVESVFSDFTINPIIFGITASARWNLKFITVDIDLGRFYNCCDSLADSLTIESYLGLTIADIKQKQKVNGGVIPIDPNTSFNTAIANRCSNFSGVGPRIGCDVAWNFADHFSLIGAASGALVIGRVKASTVNVLSDKVGISVPSCCTRFPSFPNPFHPGWLFNLDDPTFTTKFYNKKTRLRPGLALLAGLEWNYDTCNCWDVFISAAFEAQYWPDQWQCSVSPLAGQVGLVPGGGDLTMYGATISCGVHF